LLRREAHLAVWRETSETGTASQAVEVMRSRFRVSERLACRVVGQHRSNQQHGGKMSVKGLEAGRCAISRLANEKAVRC
jgi:hypothetical protein